jgi:hypothetical protein
MHASRASATRSPAPAGISRPPLLSASSPVAASQTKRARPPTCPPAALQVSPCCGRQCAAEFTETSLLSDSARRPSRSGDLRCARTPSVLQNVQIGATNVNQEPSPRAAHNEADIARKFASSDSGASRAPRIAGDVVAGSALAKARPVDYTPCAESALICSGAASRRGLPYAGSTRWQGHLGRFTGCGCGAGTAGQQQEAATVLSL